MFCLRIGALFLFVGTALGWTAPNYDLAKAPQYFAEFIKKYEKIYESDEEFNKSYETFKRNLKKINDLNEMYSTEKGGYQITQFSDQHGRRSCVGDLKRSNTTRLLQVDREYIDNAPDHLDYRENNLVTDVKNQGSCGSCYIFAAIANIESMHAKQSGNLIQLSEQQGLDCNNQNGCDGGRAVDVINALVSEGCMSEQDYPYTAVPGTCHTDKSKVKVHVVSGSEISTPDAETLKGALVQNGAPLAIALYVTESIEHAVGHQILNPSDCNNETPNHAVLLVGYSKDEATGKPYWIIKNSWGTDHGDGGFFYFDMECHCSIGIANTATSQVQ